MKWWPALPWLQLRVCLLAVGAGAVWATVGVELLTRNVPSVIYRGVSEKGTPASW